MWHDSSGNGRDTVAIIGDGPIAENHTLIFTPTDGLVFPPGSIPANFTIAVVARFTDAAASSAAIFSSVESDAWFLGWESGHEDMAQFGILKTANQTNAPDFKFRRFAASNSPTETAVISNGAEIGTAAGGTGGLTLVVNKAGFASDCEVQAVLIYDGFIFDADLAIIVSNLGTSFHCALPSTESAQQACSSASRVHAAIAPTA